MTEIPDEQQDPTTGEVAAAATKQKGKAGGPSRPYPRRTLEQALRVPRALREFNNGNEWITAEVAKAMNIGAKAPQFYYLTAASRDFGLTQGTQNTATIKLADLGRRAVYPDNAEIEQQALREAFFKVDVFRKVVEYYGGSKLPELEYAGNTLYQTFGIDPRVHDEFLDLFEKNCKFVGIGAAYEPAVSGPASLPAAKVSRTSPETVTIAEPSTPKDAPVCFVAMPFTERSDDHGPGFFMEVLANLFTPAIQAAGFEVRTAMRQGSDLIQSTIINELLDADLVLADLTEHNPNVLFELGARMVMDRPTVLVRAVGTGPIFDVDNMLRVVQYDPSLWKSTVEKDVPRLTEHIIGAWENRDTDQTFMKILRRER